MLALIRLYSAQAPDLVRMLTLQTRPQLAKRLSSKIFALMKIFFAWLVFACKRFIIRSFEHTRNGRSLRDSGHDDEETYPPKLINDRPSPQINLARLGPQDSRLGYILAEDRAIVRSDISLNQPATNSSAEHDPQYQALLSMLLKRPDATNPLVAELIERRLKTYYNLNMSYNNIEKLSLQRKINLDIKSYASRGLLKPDYYQTERFYADEENDYVCADKDYYSGCSCSRHDDSKFRFSSEHDRVEAKKRAAIEAAKAKAAAEERFRLEKIRLEEAKKAEAARLAQLAKSGGRRKLRGKLITPPPPHWLAKIKEAWAMPDKKELSRPAGGDFITPYDLDTLLKPKKYLNDKVILSYIQVVAQLANQRANKAGKGIVPKVFALDSIVYGGWQEAYETGRDILKVGCPLKRRAYLTEPRKLFELETLICPVNENKHWTLLVISPKSRKIEYIDSFGTKSPKHIAVAKHYLQAFLGPLYKEEEWRVVETVSPRQHNGYDCGVFVTTNAECIAGDVDTFCYAEADLTTERYRIAAVLLNEGFDGKDLVPAMDVP